jgi:hypothetical protein
MCWRSSRAAIATTQEALAMAEDQEALYFNLG